MKSVKLGLILMLFCVIAAGGLAYVYRLTEPIIVQNHKLILAAAIKEVLPSEGSGEAIATNVRGYSSQIKLLVGIDLLGKVSGVKIIEQQETPGLGVNITRQEFLRQFVGKNVNDQLEPKKDIDAITGATISTGAVCQGVKDALARFKSGHN
jgi:electron transport complex protein RnfG